VVIEPGAKAESTGDVVYLGCGLTPLPIVSDGMRAVQVQSRPMPIPTVAKIATHPSWKIRGIWTTPLDPRRDGYRLDTVRGDDDSER
jgi:hypothetical protein